MKAVRYHEYGDSDVLRYEDAPRPVPGPRQVVVKVAATTFNPVDAGIRGGFLAQVYDFSFPHIPGVDVSGTIAEVAEGVQDWAVGDTVVAFLPLDADGAAAEYAQVPAESLAAAPSSVPLADAAALPEPALTAWQALFEIAGLNGGQSVLINGASGAVGGYAFSWPSRPARWSPQPPGSAMPSDCAHSEPTAPSTTSITGSHRSRSTAAPSTWCSIS